MSKVCETTQSLKVGARITWHILFWIAPVSRGSSQSSWLVEVLRQLRKSYSHWAQGNRLRLRLPKADHQFEIWDTPTPPKLSRCGLYPADFSRFARLKTVDLRHTFGLTFFYDSDNIYGIHAHTTQSSCALSTYRQFSYRRRQRVAWVYVPISRTDCIAAVGVRLPLQEASVANGMCLLVS